MPRLNQARGLPWAIFCLLAGHLVLGLAHLAMLPPWEGFDETSHYSYLQQLADQRVVPRVHSARIAADVDDYALIAPMPYGNVAPYARDGGLTYQTLWVGPADRVTRVGAFVHGRPDAPRRYLAGREVNWLSMHPPLYYLALTPVYLATRQLSWAAHLLSLRFTSYLLAWAALVVGVCACATWVGSGEDGARSASRWEMLGIALWPVLVPSWFPEMARLGNDSLSTLILATAWLVTVRADTPLPSVRYSLTLGALLGAGCLTKLYFVPIAVAFLSFWLARAWSVGRASALRSAARRLAVVPLVIAGIAGWWYFGNWRDYGVALAAMEIILQERAGGFTGALAQLSPWTAVKGPLVFVATLAWPGTWSLARPPSAVIAPMVVIILLGAGAYVAALRRVPLAALAWLPAWLAAWILIAFGYHAVIRAAATGKGQPGHYLHFLVVAFGVALGLGLRSGWPRPGFRWVVAALTVYAVLFAVAVSWAQVMLFSGWLFKAEATNIYRLPEALPPFVGLPDALTRLRTLAYPGVGASAWVVGALLILGGLRLAWQASRGLERPTA